MITEEQEINGDKFNFSEFFNSSMDRVSEILESVKEVAKSEDAELIREKVRENVESLKEMSDDFKKIDINNISRDERKACKYFTKALDRMSGMYSRILNVFGNEQRESSSKEMLKALFLIVKDVSFASRDLDTAKKYAIDEDDLFNEITR